MKTLSLWQKKFDQQDYILGYGSLMSEDSRKRFSDVHAPSIAVNVSGFVRGWVTRSPSEGQTYVGAQANSNSWLNAQLLPAKIDTSLQKREQDYEFLEVAVSSISSTLGEEEHNALCDFLDKRKVWICHTTDAVHADEFHPVSQSYIDTCLAGCVEAGGVEMATTFLQTTSNWSHPRVDDRDAPVYPRAAKIGRDLHKLIDMLMTSHLKGE